MTISSQRGVDAFTHTGPCRQCFTDEDFIVVTHGLEKQILFALSPGTL